MTSACDMAHGAGSRAAPAEAQRARWDRVVPNFRNEGPPMRALMYSSLSAHRSACEGC